MCSGVNVPIGSAGAPRSERKVTAGEASNPDVPCPHCRVPEGEYRCSRDAEHKEGGDRGEPSRS